MTMKNLKSKPLSDLLELQKKISAAIAIRRQQLAKAKGRVKALAAALGMSARDLVAVTRGRGPDKTPRKTKSKPAPTKVARGRIGKNGEANHAVH